MKTRDWVMVGSGAGAATVSVLGAGGAFRWVQAAVALLCALAVGTTIPSRRRLARASPVVVLLSVAAILTALSLLPLPEAIRQLLDPVGTSLRADGATLLGTSPWPSLSRDVPGSLRALAFFLTLLAVATASLRLAKTEGGRYRLLAFVALLCGAAAAIGLIHVLVGADSLYGLYEPHARPSVLGPLLNENHFGCLMALGACVASGLLMFNRQTSGRRAFWMFLVLLCGGMTAASHSRGALLALLVGMFVTCGVLLGQRFAPADGRRGRRSFAASSLPIAIVGICIVTLVVYTSAGKVTAELGRTSIDEISQPRSKFAAWRSAETLVRESPWIGVGRGGFEPSFTRVYPASGFVTFGYIENEYIQAVVDWGIIGAVLLAAAGLWFVVVCVRRWRDSPLVAGALGAVTAVAAQSNVDFGVELLGLAVPITIVASTLAYVVLREDPGSQRLVAARALRIAHAAGLILASALLLVSSATRTLGEDHERLLDHPRAPDVASASTRHPLDYLAYAIASEQSSGYRAVELLNHAMRLHPTLPSLHRRAAEILLRTGHPEQATIEFSLALQAVDRPEALLREIIQVFPTAQVAALAIPTAIPNIDPVVRALQQLQREDVATLWLQRVLLYRAKDVHICNTLYELALSKGDLAAAEIAGRSCVEVLPDHQTRVQLANILMQRKSFAEVLHLLGDVESWHGLVTDKANAWLMLCDAHIELAHWDAAAQCLRRLDIAGDLQSDRHDELTRRLERVQEARAGSAHL